MTIQSIFSFRQELRRAEKIPVLRSGVRTKPVLRWRIDLSEGRLECRWTAHSEAIGGKPNP